MSNNEWLDIDVLEDYLDGKLDAKTMHKIERISLEDPFVAQALAGLSQSPKRVQSLSLLQKQLQDRIAQKPIEKKRWTITSQRLSIAAAAAVLFVTVSVLFWMKGNNNKQLENQQAKNVDVNIAPQVDKSETVKAVTTVPTKKAEVAIEKALTNAKRNNLAINNKKETTKPEVASLVMAAEPEKIIDKTPMPAQNVAITEEVVLSRSRIAKKANDSASLNQIISGKAKGISFVPNVNGQVVSKYNGLPIQGAEVRLSNSDISTFTNNKGEFYLRADTAKNQNLAIGSVGFATKEVKVNANQPIKIALDADQSLRETAIVGYGSYKNTGPIPVNGWDSLTKYFNDNNRLLKNGISNQLVKLSFKIQKNGRPTAIKILAGLSKTQNDEAIRLINDGPNWTLPSNTTNKVELSIKF